MGDKRGFLKLARKDTQYREACERVKDFKEIIKLQNERESQGQALRCMDCGTPFCHWGCPLGNFIPEWNDYMAIGNWEAASRLLEATNNLAEITGRVCPAICEYACVLGFNDDAVSIRENELAIIEFGFKNNLIRASKVEHRTGKRVAIVGSGPAGLSCAAQLNKAGHNVVVFERDNSPGGILRYGIPDFKLEKYIIDRRIDIWKQEGITFKTGVNIGSDYPVNKILSEFDAVCLAGGSRVPRDIMVEGRGLKGIYFAMDYLIQSNRKSSGEAIGAGELIDAKGKKVVIIGGGDTGADCVGLAHRQGASCVAQIEILPRPPECRTEEYPWPVYPLIFRTATSHEEGGQRYWEVLAKSFTGEKGHVNKVSCVRVEFSDSQDKLCPTMREIAGSEFELGADLVIIAAGFLHPEHSGLLAEFGVKLDERGNVKTGSDYMTSVRKVFSAGDMRRGQSLVVWAIAEGRNSAHYIDRYLTGESNLPLT